MPQPKPIIVPSTPLSSRKKQTSASIDIGPLFDFFKEKKRKGNLIEEFKEARGTRELIEGLQQPSEDVFDEQAPPTPSFNLEALGGLSGAQPTEQASPQLDLSALTRQAGGIPEQVEPEQPFRLTDLNAQTPEVDIPDRTVTAPPVESEVAAFRGLLGLGGPQADAQIAKGFGGIAFPEPEKAPTPPDIFAKANITDFTRESVAKAEQSGVRADLIMRPEVLDKKLRTGGQSPFQMTTVLRKEHSTASKPFLLKRGFFNDLVVSLEKPGGAGDVSMVYSYMKMLDPTSTVREGEAASAKDTAGLPASIRNTYNKLVSGAFLTPEQRLEFVDKAQDFYLNEKEIQEGNNKTYTDIAKRNKLSVADAVNPFTSKKTELNLLKIEQLQLEKLAKEDN